VADEEQPHRQSENQQLHSIARLRHAHGGVVRGVRGHVVRNCWLDRGWEEKEPRKFEGEFFRFVGHGVGPFLLVGWWADTCCGAKTWISGVSAA
jgi:hypothetical protein